MQLLPFLAVTLVVILTPGPDMAMVTRNAIRSGRRAAMETVWGIQAGLLIWASASVAGIASIVQRSAPALDTLRLVGAVYLIWLGLRAIWNARSAPARGDSGRGFTRIRSPFAQGLMSNLLNPKIGLFFTSFIPQFVESGDRAAGETVILAAIFLSLGFAWLIVFARVATAASGVLHRPHVRRLSDALVGAVLTALGIRLLADHG